MQVEQYLAKAENINEDFRLWITAEPHEAFPIGLLQMGIKITNEAPVGIKAGLRASFQWVTQDMLDAVSFSMPLCELQMQLRPSFPLKLTVAEVAKCRASRRPRFALEADRAQLPEEPKKAKVSLIMRPWCRSLVLATHARLALGWRSYQCCD